MGVDIPTHTLQGQEQFLETRHAGLQPARVWFKNNNILKAFHITDFISVTLTGILSSKAPYTKNIIVEYIIYH